MVFDTNIVVSGTLWRGAPYRAVQAAYQRQIKALISEAMLDELKEVIERPKFADRLNLLGKTSTEVVEGYAAITEIIEVESVEAVVNADADDDQVLACALSGHADYIVSGDPHLLTIEHYQNIPILAANDFLALLNAE
ncbi:MAG TPA: putative toxin-antitoxin system toxin component, PIN family [Phototrophicaceae bacterium]|nr:putative toxin-antitoxin system toxin component, PIN family [Phototrophicaceae bacterium]